MNSMQRRFLDLAQRAMLTVAMLGIGGFALPARAQAPQVDPPGRVARLSDLNGQVWLYNPDSAEWVSAARNRPLTTGDRLATDPGARAELQIGSTTLQIGASSELEVVELNDDRVALDLHDGSVIARVRDVAGAGQLDLSTDEGRFVTLRAGTYRFDHRNGKSDITVYSGQARYEGPNSGLSVNAGQRAEFWIDSGGVAQYSLLRPVNDAFAAWSNERDRRFAGNVADRYVSPEMTGAAELDAYGRWEQNPDYGSIWIPTAVAVDWAPYSHGHWTWMRPWGWTWVDDAPWGFAPFHYGRWVYVRNNWCWSPGVRVARPVYAPALVAWIGGPRGSVSVTVGGGPAVGWFPLAPREVYVPSYPVSPRYAREVNVTNVTNVTLITNVFNNPQGPREFENRRSPRAITVVPAGVMAERRPVAPAAAQFRQAPWVREIANQTGRTTAMLAPPIAAPTPPAGNPDARAVRPPPGVVAGTGDRPGFDGRPGDNPGSRSEAERPALAPGQRAPVTARPPAPTVPALANSLPPVMSRPTLQGEPTQRRPDMTLGAPGRTAPGRETVESAPGVNPRAPAAQPPRPALAQPPHEVPAMRALPAQRSEDRRDERPTQDRRPPPPRPEAAAIPQERPLQRAERPTAPRPVEQPVVPRQLEVQRPAPAAPTVQRAEPRPEQARGPRPEAPRDEPRRGEPRDPREPQR